MTWWRLIAWLIGWLLGLLLGWLYPSPARGAGLEDVAVRIENWIGPVATVGSGTLVAGNGKTALVVTVRHLFREGSGKIVVERSNHQRYPAKCLGISRFNDIAAVEMPDVGAPRIRIADRQAPVATLIGFGGTNRPWKHRGRLVEQTGRTAFYDFEPLEGDSGGGVFDDTGALTGVVWGTDGDNGAVVPLADLRRALDSPACSPYLNHAPSTNTRSQSMLPLILAASMIGQTQYPQLPDKGLPPAITAPPPTQLPATPRKATPTPQGPQIRGSLQGEATPYSLPAQTQYQTPSQYEADIPVNIRLRVIPQIESPVAQAQTYAAPAPRAEVYSGGGGGGCYGGSLSAGSYGVRSGLGSRIAVESAVAPELICGPGGCYTTGLFGLNRRSVTKIKIKERIGPGGLRGLLGGR